MTGTAGGSQKTAGAGPYRLDLGGRWVAFMAAAAVCLSVLAGVAASEAPMAGVIVAGLCALPLLMRYHRQFLLLYCLYLPFEEMVLKAVPDFVYPVMRYGGEALLLAVLVFVFTGNLIRGTGWKKTPLDVPVVLFGAVALLSMLANSVPPLVGVLGVRVIARYVAVYYIVTQSDLGREYVRLAVYIFISVGIVQIITGVVQMGWGEAVVDFFSPADVYLGGKLIREVVIPDISSGAWIFGTLSRYAIYGNYMAMFVLMLLARRYVLGETGPLVTAGMALGLVVLVASFSRKSWLALFMGFIVLNLVREKRAKSLAYLVGASLVLVLALVVNGISGGLSGELTTNPIERLLGVFSQDYLAHSMDRARLYIMTYVAYRIAVDYFWLGLGPGILGSTVTGTAAGTSALIDIGGIPNLDVMTDRLALISDVGVVTLFAQFGFLGLVVLGFIFHRLAKAALRLYRGHADPLYRSVGLAYLGFIVVMVVGNIIGFSLTYRVLSYNFWLFGGLVMAGASGVKDGR